MIKAFHKELYRVVFRYKCQIKIGKYKLCVDLKGCVDVVGVCEGVGMGVTRVDFNLDLPSLMHLQRKIKTLN